MDAVVPSQVLGYGLSLQARQHLCSRSLSVYRLRFQAGAYDLVASGGALLDLAEAGTHVLPHAQRLHGFDESCLGTKQPGDGGARILNDVPYLLDDAVGLHPHAVLFKLGGAVSGYVLRLSSQWRRCACVCHERAGYYAATVLPFDLALRRDLCRVVLLLRSGSNRLSLLTKLCRIPGLQGGVGGAVVVLASLIAGDDERAVLRPLEPKAVAQEPTDGGVVALSQPWNPPVVQHPGELCHLLLGRFVTGIPVTRRRLCELYDDRVNDVVPVRVAVELHLQGVQSSSVPHVLLLYLGVHGLPLGGVSQVRFHQVSEATQLKHLRL